MHTLLQSEPRGANESDSSVGSLQSGSDYSAGLTEGAGYNQSRALFVVWVQLPTLGRVLPSMTEVRAMESSKAGIV